MIEKLNRLIQEEAPYIEIKKIDGRDEVDWETYKVTMVENRFIKTEAQIIDITGEFIKYIEDFVKSEGRVFLGWNNTRSMFNVEKDE